MEKNLELIKKANNNYALKDGNVEIVELVSLKVNSQTIYDKLYLSTDINLHEFKITVYTTLPDKEDKKIMDQLNTLFKSIDDAITLEFSTQQN